MHYTSVYEAIAKSGHDEDFVPNGKDISTGAPAGSTAKVELLRRRVELGLELWNDEDNPDCARPDELNSKPSLPRQVRDANRRAARLKAAIEKNLKANQRALEKAMKKKRKES